MIIVINNNEVLLSTTTNAFSMVTKFPSLGNISQQVFPISERSKTNDLGRALLTNFG